MDVERRIRKARIQLMRKSPFFGNLALHLELKKADYVQTSAVDEKNHLLYCEEFIKKIKFSELIGLCAHEVMHLALNVFGRRKGRDPMLWNQAHDHCINILIRDSGLELPPGGLQDERFRDMAAERVYDVLKEEQKDQEDKRIISQYTKGNSNEEEDGKQIDGNNQGDGYGTGGGCCDHSQQSSQTKSQQEKQQGQWERKMIQAANSAEKRGNLPAGIKRLIDELVHPQLPWKEILKSFVRDILLSRDFSYRRPSRSSVATGIYMPCMIPDSGVPAVAFDTSGSISPDFIKTGLSEIQEVLEECRSIIRFLSTDADVHSDIESDDIWEIAENMIGGGGTDFNPIFEKLEEDPPGGLIFFTDMWACFPEEPPNYPVMWITPENHGDAPWGQLIELKDV